MLKLGQFLLLLPIHLNHFKGCEAAELSIRSALMGDELIEMLQTLTNKVSGEFLEIW